MIWDVVRHHANLFFSFIFGQNNSQIQSQPGPNPTNNLNISYVDPNNVRTAVSNWNATNNPIINSYTSTPTEPILTENNLQNPVNNPVFTQPDLNLNISDRQNPANSVQSDTNVNNILNNSSDIRDISSNNSIISPDISISSDQADLTSSITQPDLNPDISSVAEQQLEPNIILEEENMNNNNLIDNNQTTPSASPDQNTDTRTPSETESNMPNIAQTGQADIVTNPSYAEDMSQSAIEDISQPIEIVSHPEEGGSHPTEGASHPNPATQPADLGTTQAGTDPSPAQSEPAILTEDLGQMSQDLTDLYPNLSPDNNATIDTSNDPVSSADSNPTPTSEITNNDSEINSSHSDNTDSPQTQAAPEDLNIAWNNWADQATTQDSVNSASDLNVDSNNKNNNSDISADDIITPDEVANPEAISPEMINIQEVINAPAVENTQEVITTLEVTTTPEEAISENSTRDDFSEQPANSDPIAPLNSDNSDNEDSNATDKSSNITDNPETLNMPDATTGEENRTLQNSVTCPHCNHTYIV